MNVMNDFKLKGQVALVTGGARHLGYDMADALAEAGADVIVTSRDAESAKAAAEQLRKTRGVDAMGMGVNVVDHAEVAEMAKKAAAWKGHLDILINNAGGTPPGTSPAWLFDRDPKAIAELLNVNLLGTIYCCQEVGRIMAAQKSGRIINIASIAALVGRDRKMYQRNKMNGQPVDYAAAKAGIVGLTYDLAAMMGPFGVRVNAISPGGFARKQPGDFERDYSERTALGRMGRDGIDLKGAALFLASPASDYVTGHNLVVDGGFVIWH